MQQAILQNVNSISSSCSINILGAVSYYPSKIVMYHMNFTHFVRNFITEFAESEAKELNLKFHKTLYHVPSYMGLFKFFFIGLVIFLGVMLVRCLIINKI